MPEWLMVIVRSLSILAILFFITKLLGKRQISQLSYFEYIGGMTIGDIAAEVSTGLEQNYTHGVFSILVFSMIPFLAGLLALKNKKIRDFVEGKATVVIKDGKILEDNLKKEKYTSDELLELLRKKDVFRVADVEFAVLEAAGELNVLVKKENQPLTPSMVGLQVATEKEPQTVIMDGKILDEPLTASGHNRHWLLTELKKIGISQDNVFIGQVDSTGVLTVDVYDDKIQVPSSQEKPLLLATLKKCQADLELFSLETESRNAADMYRADSERIENIINKIAFLLKE